MPTAPTLTKTQLLATDFDARMTVTPEGGTATTVTARNLLSGISTPEYWIQGEVCSEFLVRNFTQNINNQINVQYYVRKYPGWDGFRVDTVVENVWGDYRGNLEYDFNLELGNSNPQSVFAKTNFVHTFNARWHKTIWQGNTPPAIEIRYNLPYMIATGLLPKYDTNLVVPESTIASRYTSWSNSGHDIMDNGIMTVYFGGTGGREDIGLFPTWTARYLISMDNRCKEIMLNCADLSGSIPIHVRESDSNRSFYQHILSIDDRPTIWISDPTNPNRQTAADRLPAAVGPLTSEWSVDRAHQPSLAYIPYIVTGDFYYLEEMYFWAGWDLADGNWGYRLSDTGLIADQVRGEAWAIRNIGDAGHIAPDAHALEKSYFIEKVNNNITAWTAEYIANTANYPTVHFWQRQTNMAYDGGNVDTTIDSTCRHYSSPWMEDFLIVTFAHLKDAGFDTGGLLDWVGDSRVNLFAQADYNPNRGAPVSPAHHLQRRQQRRHSLCHLGGRR